MLLSNFIVLFLDSAFWLLLGLVLAGMLKMFVPMAWMHKQLGGHGFKSTLKAALLGAPLPLCSCGVIPAAIGLRRSGASKAATTSFLVSTPETGVDSITISYVLLGPFMAVVRPISAILSAITAGILVGRDEHDEETSQHAVDTPNPVKDQQASTNSCCSKKQPEIKSCCSAGQPKAKISSQAVEKIEKKQKSSGCCSAQKDIAPELKKQSIKSRLFEGLQFAATDMVRDTTVWLLIGLFFAAIVQTYIPTDFMARWGDGILAMLVMVIISIPMYICATASTPIAAGLLLAGVSPGAVLVFMLAGPATNIATLGVVTKELGQRALLGYLGGVLGIALISGILVNYLVNTFHFEVMPQVGEQHEMLPDVLVYGSGIILAILMVRVLINKLPKKSSKKSCCSSS